MNGRDRTQTRPGTLRGAPPPPLRGPIVLVVEPDRAVQRALTDFLEGDGFRVITEIDGRWALRTFEARPIDVVLVDVQLPGMDGLELCDRVRRTAQGREAALVLLAAPGSPGRYAEHAARRAALGVLERAPLRLDALRAMLLGHLRERYPARPVAGARAPAAVAPPPRDDSVSAPLPAVAVPPRDDSVSERLADAAQRRERAEVEEELSESVPSLSLRWGRLEGARFPRLLHDLYRRSMTGALYVRWEEAKKIVYIRQGRPMGVKSNLLNECLGRILVRERMISEEECEQSLRLMRSSRRQQGTVLIEMGCISPHNLAYALDLQLRLKLYDVFSWRGGEYAFADGHEPAAPAQAFDASPGELIREGITLAFDDERVRAELEPHAHRKLRVAPDPLYRFQDLGLDDAERRFLDNIQKLEGRITVGHILAAEGSRRAPAAAAGGPPGAGGLDALRRKQLLLALLCAEVVLLGEAAVDESTSTVLSSPAAPAAAEADADARLQAKRTSPELPPGDAADGAATQPTPLPLDADATVAPAGDLAAPAAPMREGGTGAAPREGVERRVQADPRGALARDGARGGTARIVGPPPGAVAAGAAGAIPEEAWLEGDTFSESAPLDPDTGRDDALAPAAADTESAPLAADDAPRDTAGAALGVLELPRDTASAALGVEEPPRDTAGAALGVEEPSRDTASAALGVEEPPRDTDSMPAVPDAAEGSAETPTPRLEDPETPTPRRGGDETPTPRRKPGEGEGEAPARDDETPTPRRDVRALAAAASTAADGSQTEIISESLLAARRRADLARRLQAMRGAEPAEALSVDPRAAPDVIRGAYEQLAGELHPDRFRGASAEVRAAARAALALARSAYEVLAGLSARPLPITADQARAVDRLVEAERHLRRGRDHLDRSRWMAAREALRRAVELCGEEAEYHALLGWATYRAAPALADAVADAERHLARATELDPRLDRPHVYRGYLYKDRAEATRADAAFERALQCNPDCAEALAELRLEKRPPAAKPR
jgi:DNA-binding response OmpR family regulator